MIAFKRYGLPKICPQKKKSYVLFNEVGKKLNKNKGLQYFFVTHKYIPVKNWCNQISFGSETVWGVTVTPKWVPFLKCVKNFPIKVLPWLDMVTGKWEKKVR